MFKAKFKIFMGSNFFFSNVRKEYTSFDPKFYFSFKELSHFGVPRH